MAEKSGFSKPGGNLIKKTFISRHEVEGLQTDPNEISKAKPGSLRVAENVVVNRRGLVESRRGFDPNAIRLPADLHIKQIIPFGNELIYYGSDNLLHRVNDAGELINYETVVETDNPRLRYVETENSLLLSTKSGILKLDSINSQPILAGLPKALTPVEATGTHYDGTDINKGIMTEAGQKIRYRAVYSYLNTQGILISSEPSDSIVISAPTGTSETKTYSPAVDLPWFQDLPNGTVVELYASPIAPSTFK